NNSRWCKDDYRIRYCYQCGYTNHTSPEDCQWHIDRHNYSTYNKNMMLRRDKKVRITKYTLHNLENHHIDKLITNQTANALLSIRTSNREEPVELAYDTDDISDLSPDTPTSTASLVMFDDLPTEKVYFQTNTPEPEIITAATHADVAGRDGELTHLVSTYFDEKWENKIKNAYATNNYRAQHPARKFYETDGLLFEWVTIPGEPKPQLKAFIRDVEIDGITLREVLLATTHEQLGVTVQGTRRDGRLDSRER